MLQARNAPSFRVVVGSLDGVAIELGERHERHDLAVVDVRPRDGERAVGLLVLDHLEQALGARRAHRDHHDAPDLQLLEERRWDVVDAAGDDDLVERSGLFPTVIAVGVLAGDRLVFGVAARDQRVVDAARALGQRLDDLDGPDLVGEVGEIGGLVARAGADLEHLVAELHVDRRGHAAHHMRPRNGDAVADVEEGVVVGAPEVLFEHELLARHHQEGALVAVVEHVPVVQQGLVARPVLPEKTRLLAAIGHHPADIGVAVVERRRDVIAVRLGDIGPGKSRRQRAGHGAAGPKQKSPSLHVPLPSAPMSQPHKKPRANRPAKPSRCA